MVEDACTQFAAIAVTESVDRKWLASALVVTIARGVLLLSGSESVSDELVELVVLCSPSIIVLLTNRGYGHP